MLAPFTRQAWGNETWLLCADHGAWYTLESLTKSGYMDTVNAFIDPGRQSPDPTYLLLWAFSSNHRDTDKLSFRMTEEEIAAGHRLPRSFLRKIPTGAAFQEVELSLLRLLQEAGLITFSGPGEADEARPIDPPPQ